MYNGMCAFADTMAVDTASSDTVRVSDAGRSTTYGVTIVNRRVAAAGAAVGDELFEAQRRNEQISRALVILDSGFFEDYGRALDRESLESFARLMAHHVDLRIPLLGAESSGKLVATWESNGGCLSLRFVGSDRVHYAVSQRCGGEVSRTWGETNTVDLFGSQDMKRLAAH